MNRLTLFLILFFLSCGGSQKETENGNQFNYEGFAEKFRTGSLPFTFSDTGFLKNRDTASIRDAEFVLFVSDSIKKRMFGNAKNVRYVPLYRFEKDGQKYFLLKTIAAQRKAALLVSFSGDQFGASIPFLIPDADPNTSQVSIIDRSFSITRNVTRKLKDESVVDGKDVYAFDPSSKNFVLIMTDILDETNLEVINPIDTFPRKHKFAGEYGKDKKNFVSVRDGRNNNEISFFIHFEKDKATCTGELKGSAVFTSTTTAVFRQGTCVLELKFSNTTVTLRETGACGTYRGVKCSFDGSYAKKKISKPKTPAKKI